MNRQLAAILIGCVAGLAAGLMALAGFKAATAAIPLLFAAPIAVQIATLGWGPLAGAIATVAAVVVAGFGAGAQAAAIAAVMLFVPAAWTANLINLAQPSADGRTLIWYPLARALTHLTLAIVAGCWISGYVLGYSDQAVAEIFRELMVRLQEARPDLPPPPSEAIEATSRFYAAAIPFAIPAMWLMLHVLALNISAQITRLSGRLPRPADDIARDAGLPFAMLALPLGGIGAMFALSSPYYDLAAVVAGAGVAAFGLIGLAELHLITRGRAGRPLILSATYLVLVLIGLPLLAFAVLGAIRISRRNTQPPVLPPSRGGPNPS